MIKLQIEPPIQSLVNELEGMKEGFGQKGLRAGLVAGAKPVKTRMKAIAPERSGALKKAVSHRMLTRRDKSRLSIRDSEVGLLVGPTKKVMETLPSGVTKRRGQGHKARWLEFGTKHMAARPFMAPALDQAEQGFEDRFYRGLTNYVERQRARRRHS